MELKLDRKYKQKDYTIGKLYINGAYFCDVLEDPDRGLSDSMKEDVIIENKQYGNTAIPTGTYHIQMGVESPKFKSRSWAVRWGGKLPRLLNVKGFSGVLMHVGNTPADTLGCLLVGRNTVKGKVKDSTATFDRLMQQLVEADYRGEDIIISIS